ncbi:MAG TPA: hypothetical protein VFS74_10590 [Gemmatimonadales bacterium]|nr:hypothetical protein [Gemmatimonadales bacterium]
MVTPGMLSGRRVPETVRVDFDVVIARAWQALAQTHEEAAVTFVRRLSPRIGTDAALQRYFREVAVPLEMREAVRTGALLALTPEERRRAGDDGVESWNFMRPDQLVGAVRRRSRFVEETTLALRLAAAAADELVTITHVRMALETAHVMSAALPVDEAVMHYIRAFDLSNTMAQVVFQRAMARLADLDIQVTSEMPVVAAPAPARLAPLRMLGLRATG